MDDATLAALRTAASALFDIGFATMVGALAVRVLVADVPSGRGLRCLRRCRRLFLAACLGALAASLAWLEVQAITMTELPPGAALLASGDLVAHTQFGRAWALATLAMAACAVLAFAARHRPLPLRRLALALALAATAHAAAGHAGAYGFDWLLAATALHVLATGAWAGGVLAAAVVLRDPMKAPEGRRTAERLSTLATAALAVVVATGIACAWHGLGGSVLPLHPSSGSPWGLVLDAKLALVAIAVALGGFNRLAVMPALPGAWPRFARVLRVEAVVLLAALVAAALLANGAPPAP